MSEALPPPQQQQDADIATMAADLAKRRRRLQLLNLAILLVPLAAGVIFLAFGRNHNERVVESVTEKASSRVAATVENAVPRAVDAVAKVSVPREVKASLKETVLPAVRTTVAQTVPLRVEEALTKAQVTERLDTLETQALETAPSASAERIREVEKDLADLKERLTTQEKTLKTHTRQIEGLGRVRGLSAEDLIRRLKEAEARLQAIPSGLDELPNLPRPMREGLRNVGQVREDLQELRELLERANQE